MIIYYDEQNATDAADFFDLEDYLDRVDFYQSEGIDYINQDDSFIYHFSESLFYILSNTELDCMK